MLITLLSTVLISASSGVAFADEAGYGEHPVGVVVHEEGPLPEAWDIQALDMSDGPAPDYTDQDLILLLNKNTTWGSQIRPKGTRKSVYARIDTMGTFARLYTEGWNRDCSNHANCTWGGVANLYREGKYEIYNSIGEGFWWNAQITAWRDTGSASAITGAWSPDYMTEAGVSVLNP